jgi:uncharacterized protein (TIGR02145 family)
MKTKSWFYTLLLTGLLITLLLNCKKEVSPEEENPIPPSNGSVYDADGNKYNILSIGYQGWLATNLKTTKYNDGTAIPLVRDNNAWRLLSTPGYCWYKNDSITYKKSYGALYNWFTIKTGKLCPIGWRVPSDEEWSQLIRFLGGEAVAGGNLKEPGTLHWYSPNYASSMGNGNDFGALPGGYRNTYAGFSNIEYSGYWWSSTEFGTTYAWHRFMINNGTQAFKGGSEKLYGYSVRCLR